MVFVKIREGEGIEEALRRFKREVQREGLPKEMRRREHYIPPSAKKKLKRIEAARKRRRGRSRARGVGRTSGPPRPSAGPGR
ncbi:MAG: 30S ribosomal protein S21 [Elusimicrobiota bacterium]